jgi:DNA-binding NarL/FixJ family response regulator
MPRVVVADDHSSVLAAFVRMLKRCEVLASVSNGQDAIGAVVRLHPDVLVVDLMMPEIDGLEVCRRVKRVAPDVDVVIVTACDDADVQGIALENGAAAYVPKHSAATMLEDTILRIVASRRHSQSIT